MSHTPRRDNASHPFCFGRIGAPAHASRLLASVASASAVAVLITACDGGSGASVAASAPVQKDLGTTVTGTTSTTSTATTAPDNAPYASTSGNPLALGCTPKQVVSSGGYTSCNMQWLGRYPIPGNSIGARLVGSTYYVTNWQSGFYAFDASTPENPKQIGNLAIDLGNVAAGTVISAVENEDTAANGKIAILSRTPYNDSVVIDTSDPTRMKLLTNVLGAQAHTQTCINNCSYAYGSTTGTIVDLRNPASPVLLPNKWTDVTGGVSAHDLTEIYPGLVITASDPAFLLDTSDPANPKQIFALPQSASQGPAPVGPAQSGHLGHNNLWPRGGRDQYFLGLSEGVYDGRCELHPNDGRTIYVYDTTNYLKNKNFTLTSQYTLVSGNGDTGSAGGVQQVDSNGNPSTVELGIEGCSVHWFDIHPKFHNGGLIALSAFSHGIRLLQVHDGGKIDQIGYYVPDGVPGTVAVHWISDNVMYAIDAVHGWMDVIKYTGSIPASQQRTSTEVERNDDDALPLLTGVLSITP